MAENKAEEETYSVIFASLKHPVRRRILRMLAEKPLNFSEIQESLAIDSGHLSYHLESLSDLVAHFQNGKYGLSSIGMAAVKLMSGVEEHRPQTGHEKLKPRHIISTVYPLILVGALLIACLFALNYSVISRGSVALGQSVPTGTPADIAIDKAAAPATPIYIGINEAIGFNVTTERVPLTGSYNIKIDTEPVSKTGFIPTLGSPLSIENGFGAPIKAIMLSQGEIQKLYLGLNITSSTGIFIGTGSPNGTFVISAVSPVLPLVVRGPDGASSEWTPQWKTDGSITEYLIPPSIDVTAPGTYVFELAYGNQGGIVNWNGYLTLNAAWQFLERPYFYYGLAGLIIAWGYIAFVTVGLLQKRKTKTPKLWSHAK